MYFILLLRIYNFPHCIVICNSVEWPVTCHGLSRPGWLDAHSELPWRNSAMMSSLHAYVIQLTVNEPAHPPPATAAQSWQWLREAAGALWGKWKREKGALERLEREKNLGERQTGRGSQLASRNPTGGRVGSKPGSPDMQVAAPTSWQKHQGMPAWDLGWTTKHLLVAQIPAMTPGIV